MEAKGKAVKEEEGKAEKRGWLCIPKVIQRRILHEAHNIPTRGHIGSDRTYLRIRDRYLCNQKWRDTQRYIAGCELCHRTNHRCRKPIGLLPPLLMAKGRCQSISIDFITDLPVSGNSHNYIVTFVHHMTKRAHWWACRLTMEATAFVPIFIDDIIRLHRPPTRSASRGCVWPGCTLQSRLMERSSEDCANEAAHVNGIPPRHGGPIRELEQGSRTLFAWLCHSRSGQSQRQPHISEVCWYFLSAPFDEADTIWTRSWLCATFATTLLLQTSTSCRPMSQRKPYQGVNSLNNCSAFWEWPGMHCAMLRTNRQRSLTSHGAQSTPPAPLEQRYLYILRFYQSHTATSTQQDTKWYITTLAHTRSSEYMGTRSNWTSLLTCRSTTVSTSAGSKLTARMILGLPGDCHLCWFGQAMWAHVMSLNQSHISNIALRELGEDTKWSGKVRTRRITHWSRRRIWQKHLSWGSNIGSK